MQYKSFLWRLFNMEFIGYYGIKHSNIYGKDFAVFEYREETPSKVPYTYCSCCNKPIKRRMFVLQNPETDVEEYYLGFDCAKKILK